MPRFITALVFAAACAALMAFATPALAKDRDHVEVVHVAAKFDAQSNVLRLRITLPAGKVVRRTIVGDRAIDRTLKILEIAANDNARLYVDVRNEKPKDLTIEIGDPSRSADAGGGRPKFRDSAGG